MKQLPYFPFYPGEWLRSPTIMGMSLAEQGGFLKLLCIQWEDGFVDPADVYAILGMEEDLVTTMLERRCWKRAMTLGEDGMLRNERLSNDREAAAGKVNQAKEAADARWAKHKAAGSPVKKRVNGDAELQKGITDAELKYGMSVSASLRTALVGYMQARRLHKKSTWKSFQWVDNLGGEFSFEEWEAAYVTAARAGWASVHPKHGGSGRVKGNVGLNTLKGWAQEETGGY